MACWVMSKEEDEEEEEEEEEKEEEESDVPAQIALLNSTAWVGPAHSMIIPACQEQPCWRWQFSCLVANTSTYKHKQDKFWWRWQPRQQE